MKHFLLTFFIVFSSFLGFGQLEILSNDTICHGDSIEFHVVETAQNPFYSWVIDGVHNQQVVSQGIRVPVDNFSDSIRTVDCVVSFVDLLGISITYDTVFYVYPKKLASIVDPGPVCDGDTFLLASQTKLNGLTYSWSGGGITSNTANTWYQAELQFPGYQIIVNNAFCNYVSPVFNVNVISLPDKFITPDASTTICLGDSVKLTPTELLADSYIWTNTHKSDTISTNFELVVGNKMEIALTTFKNGCKSHDTIFIDTVPAITYLVDNVVHDKGDNSGRIEISTSGGTGVLLHKWSNGINGKNLSNLAPGNYFVTVSDNKGCEVVDTVEVQNDCNFTIDIALTQKPDCGQTNGELYVTSSIDTSLLSYHWSNGSFTSNAKKLSTGIYTVSATNQFGCKRQAYFTLGNKGLDLSVVKKDMTCFETNDGEIDLIVTNGTPPYNYHWTNTNQSKNKDLTGLKNGLYLVFVTDAKLCVGISGAYIQKPEKLDIETSVIEPTCGQNDGVITISGINNGTPSYSYSWKNTFGGTVNSTTNSATMLESGVYQVEVIDDNGCVGKKHISLNDSDGPKPLVEIIWPKLSCSADGIYSTAFFGGTLPYTYAWKHGVDTALSTNISFPLDLGENYIAMQDANGCKYSNYKNFGYFKPWAPFVCLVSVDTVNGVEGNKIIWNKDSASVKNQKILGYNVYRESYIKNEYDSIAFVPVDELSQYFDPHISPKSKSWKYKFSTVDSCGIESALSSPHKTMQLVTKDGFDLLGNSGKWMYWDDYQGYWFSQYYINRYSKEKGLEEKIDSVSSIFAKKFYFDKDYPNLTNVSYYISCETSSICEATKAPGATVNKSKSNKDIVFSEETLVEFLRTMKKQFQVIPNPAKNKFEIGGDLIVEKILVYDLLGNKMLETNSTTVDVEFLSSGSYVVSILSNNQLENHILIKE
jgi:hypothetical protein